MLPQATLLLSVLLQFHPYFAQDVTIQVGGDPDTRGGSFQFIPPAITATNGSVITFVFSGSPGNHSVTQTLFSDPCQPLPGGFDSGFVHIPADTYDGFPAWNLTILDDTAPLWFYCAQTLPIPHCPNGMVGSINAPVTGSETFLAFQNEARHLNWTGFTPDAPTPSLNGTGAFASVPPGPLGGNISGYAVPTPTMSAAKSSSSAEPAATKLASFASGLVASATTVYLAVAFAGSLAVLGM